MSSSDSDVAASDLSLAARLQQVGGDTQPQDPHLMETHENHRKQKYNPICTWHLSHSTPVTWLVACSSLNEVTTVVRCHQSNFSAKQNPARERELLCSVKKTGGKRGGAQWLDDFRSHMLCQKSTVCLIAVRSLNVTTWLDRGCSLVWT